MTPVIRTLPRSRPRLRNCSVLTRLGDSGLRMTPVIRARRDPPSTGSVYDAGDGDAEFRMPHQTPAEIDCGYDGGFHDRRRGLSSALRPRPRSGVLENPLWGPALAGFRRAAPDAVGDPGAFGIGRASSGLRRPCRGCRRRRAGGFSPRRRNGRAVPRPDPVGPGRIRPDGSGRKRAAPLTPAQNRPPGGRCRPPRDRRRFAPR
jgi:hypothetical protein